MRTFRLLGMALLAIVMCANFTACSSDDDEVIKDDDGVITNQKKLVEIKSTSDDGETTLWEYSYDTKGRLVSVTRTETIIRFTSAVKRINRMSIHKLPRWMDESMSAPIMAIHLSK